MWLWDGVTPAVVICTWGLSMVWDAAKFDKCILLSTHPPARPSTHRSFKSCIILCLAGVAQSPPASGSIGHAEAAMLLYLLAHLPPGLLTYTPARQYSGRFGQYSGRAGQYSDRVGQYSDRSGQEQGETVAGQQNTHRGVQDGSAARRGSTAAGIGLRRKVVGRGWGPWVKVRLREAGGGSVKRPGRQGGGEDEGEGEDRAGGGMQGGRAEGGAMGETWGWGRQLGQTAVTQVHAGGRDGRSSHWGRRWGKGGVGGMARGSYKAEPPGHKDGDGGAGLATALTEAAPMWLTQVSGSLIHCFWVWRVFALTEFNPVLLQNRMNVVCMYILLCSGAALVCA